MSTPLDQYTELLSLTRLYLQQESSTQPWIATDNQTYLFFKKLAQQQSPKKQPLAPEIKKVESTPSPKPISTIIKAPKANEEAPPSTSTPEPILANEKIKHNDKTVHNPLQLSPLPEIPHTDLQDMHRIISERFPSLTILDVPDDGKAKQSQSKECLTPVILLAFNNNPQQLKFLEHLAKAINNQLTTATVLSAQQIEQEKGWSKLLASKELRLIIANIHSMQSLPDLMGHYKEVPKQSKFYLDHIPLQLLSDFSIYFKEPHLKIGLWNMLCSAILHLR